MLMWELLGKGDAGELMLYVESDGPSQRNGLRAEKMRHTKQSHPSAQEPPLVQTYGTRSQEAEKETTKWER